MKGRSPKWCQGQGWSCPRGWERRRDKSRWTRRRASDERQAWPWGDRPRRLNRERVTALRPAWKGPERETVRIGALVRTPCTAPGGPRGPQASGGATGLQSAKGGSQGSPSPGRGARFLAVPGQQGGPSGLALVSVPTGWGPPRPGQPGEDTCPSGSQFPPMERGGRRGPAASWGQSRGGLHPGAVWKTLGRPVCTLSLGGSGVPSRHPQKAMTSTAFTVKS